MKLLYISALFPNPGEPLKGLFNAYQVQALSKYCTLTVIAPTAQAMPSEETYGARVSHPEFFHVPVLTRPWNGLLFAQTIKPLVQVESFDIAFASFAYPDGYGVMQLAERLHFPFAIDVLGSDINKLFNNPHRRRQILRALHASCAVFAKSRALADQLAAHGIRAHIDYNGIDHSIFHPRDRREACHQLNLSAARRRILFVGNLQRVKGPRLLAAAFEHLRDIADLDLVFIGSGPEAAHLSLGGRVQHVGPVEHQAIATWMNACDLLCVPSRHEGLPNVILEALACGRPVVASQVGGIPEIVQDQVNGRLVPAGDVPALARAVRATLTQRWDATDISRTAERFDWDQNAQAIVAILEQALALQRH